MKSLRSGKMRSQQPVRPSPDTILATCHLKTLGSVVGWTLKWQNGKMVYTHGLKGPAWVVFLAIRVGSAHDTRFGAFSSVCSFDRVWFGCFVAAHIPLCWKCAPKTRIHTTSETVHKAECISGLCHLCSFMLSSLLRTAHWKP